MSDTAVRDWRTMDAGRALDEVIARRLGLPAVAIYSRVAEPGSPGRWRYNELGYSKTYQYDSGGFNDVAPVPPYSTDLNVTLTLIAEHDGFSLSHDTHENVWMADLDTIPPTYEVADTPALAICRAWLAYQDCKQAD